MAMQTSSLLPVPSSQVVGNAFVEKYHHVLHHSPELVYRFYQNTSVLSRPDANCLMTTVTSMKTTRITGAEIKTTDAQDSIENGVIVSLTGCLTRKENLRRKFTQTFFLASQDKGYHVLNDVFRYVEDTEPCINAGTIIGVDDAPSSSLTQDPEPTQVVGPSNVNHEICHVEEVEIIEEKVEDQVMDERQAGNEVDILVEADSHLNENHVSNVAESANSASQEDTPKKSYASIVSSLTKKGPIKVYVPTDTARLASATTEKQSVNPVAHTLVPETSSPTAPIDAPESTDAQDDVDGHSIYIAICL